MALDGIFLHHLKNEIEAFAVGSRIEKIYQPSKEELVFSLRSREGAKKLLLSCKADSARIHFTDYPPENPSKPPMLCMLFRKHLTSSKITAV
ncbi:MAG: NFACT family protein, partial [Eubacterium sp.]|nr:NFACT family protein [Eubacterium sp.]